MATDYTVRLTGQDNLTQTIKSTQNALDSFSDRSKKLDAINDRFKRIQGSAAPLKTKLKELQAIMAQMNLDGLSNTDVFTKIAGKAANAKDAIADAGQAVRLLSSDTSTLDAGIQAFQLLTGGISICAGTMGLLGVENKNVEQALLKVQSAVAMLNGVQAIANVLNKDSILMLKMKQLHQIGLTAATEAATVAEGVNTAATGTNTIARKAWNYVTAISKALIGDFTGLAIVGAGVLLTYALCTANATDKEKEHSETLKATEEAQNNYNSTLASTFANLMAKYQDLRLQWNLLKTESEKQEFLIDQKANIDAVTNSVDDVISAEKFFNDQTSSVVQSFMRRAQAAAYMAKLTDLYKKQIELTTQIEASDQRTQQGHFEKYKKYMGAKAGDTFEWGDKFLGEIFRSGVTQNGNIYYDIKRGKAVYTEAGAALARNEGLARANSKVVSNGAWTNNLRQQLRNVKAEIISTENAMQSFATNNPDLYTSTTSTPHHTPRTSTNTTNKNSGNHSSTAPKPEKTSEEKISELTQQLEALQKVVDNPKSTNKQVENAKNKIENVKLDIRKEYENLITAIRDKFKAGILDREETIDQINKLNSDLQGIGLNPISVDIALDETEMKRQFYKDAEEIANTIKSDFEMGIIDENVAKAQIQILNKALEEQGLNPIEVEITPNKNSVNYYLQELEKIEKKLNEENLDVETRIKLLKAKTDIQQQINEITNGEVSIKAIVEPTYIRKGSIDDKRLSKQNADSRFSQIQSDYESGLIDKETAKQQIADLNKELSSLGIKPIEIDFDTSGAMKSVQEMRDAVLQLADTFRQNSEQNLINWLGKGDQVQQEIAEQLQAIFTLRDNMLQFGELLKNNADMSELAGAGMAMLGQAMTQLGGDGAIGKIGATMAAIGQIILGFATASAQAAALGPFGWLAFTGAGLAAVATMISTIKSYADGGIIGGNSFHGDKIFARVNAGEMILNPKQQANLFRLLDNGGTTSRGGKVEFKISGSTLKGVLRNYDNKMNKIKG